MINKNIVQEKLMMIHYVKIRFVEELLLPSIVRILNGGKRWIYLTSRVFYTSSTRVYYRESAS